MSYEKIFRKEDGSRVKVLVSPIVDMGELRFDYHVQVCAKGKRTWTHPIDKAHYKYRELSMSERIALCKKSYIETAGTEWINYALNEYWLSVKPKA